MKRFGQFVSWLGVVLGVAVGLIMFIRAPLTGIAWVAAVGTAKFGFLSALGLIAGGAVVQRIAIRSAEREQLRPGSPH
jgi:hypothetical protein